MVSLEQECCCLHIARFELHSSLRDCHIVLSPHRYLLPQAQLAFIFLLRDSAPYFHCLPLLCRHSPFPGVRAHHMTFVVKNEILLHYAKRSLLTFMQSFFYRPIHWTLSSPLLTLAKRLPNGKKYVPKKVGFKKKIIASWVQSWDFMHGSHLHCHKYILYGLTVSKSFIKPN